MSDIIEQLKEAEKQLGARKELLANLNEEVEKLSDEKIGYLKEIKEVKNQAAGVKENISLAVAEMRDSQEKAKEKKLLVVEAELNLQKVNEEISKERKAINDKSVKSQVVLDGLVIRELSIKEKEAVSDRVAKDNSGEKARLKTLAEKLDAEESKLLKDKTEVDADKAKNDITAFESEEKIRANDKLTEELRIQKMNILDAENELRSKEIVLGEKINDAEKSKLFLDRKIKDLDIDISQNKKEVSKLENDKNSLVEREKKVKIRELRVDDLIRKSGVDKELAELEKRLDG